MARFSEAEKTLIWDRRSQGVGMRTVARELGRAHGSVRWMVESYGGVRPRTQIRSSRHLSLEEREEISRGMAAGESLRSIARRLGRSASTVSREVARNGGGRSIGRIVPTRRRRGGLAVPKPANWPPTRPWL